MTQHATGTREKSHGVGRTNETERSRGPNAVANRRSRPAAPLAAAGNQAVQRLFAKSAIQLKLQLGSPDDPAEYEADRIAEETLQSRAPCSCDMGGGIPCPSCREHALATLQRKPRSLVASHREVPSWASSGFALSAGRTLGESERNYFEPRLGADLGGVQIHTGYAASHAAKQLNARAFTLGANIAFADGEYRPESDDGRHLLAHELAHVLQQEATPVIRRNDDSGTELLECSGEAVAEEREGIDAAELATYVATPEEPGVCEGTPFVEEGEAPDPGPDTVAYNGWLLGANGVYLRYVLGHIALAGGYAAMRSYADGLTYAVSAPGAPVTCPPTEGTRGPAQGVAISAEDVVLLAEIEPILQNELSVLESDYLTFGALVRQGAIARLRLNHYNLGLWSDYVAGLAPEQVMGMALAQQERPVMMQFLHSKSQGPFDPMDIAERRAWSTSRHERDYLERLGTGQIHGGCQQCHESQLWRNLEYANPTRGEAAIPLAERLPMNARVNVETPAPSGNIAWEGEERPAIPDWAWESFSNRPGVTAMAHALNEIRDYLRPLGDEGYRIISSDMVKSATDGAELVSAVLAAIVERREGYLNLIAEMESPDYDFLEPLQVLQNLLPLADRDVRNVINGELAKRQRDKEAEGIAALILGIAAMLLTIFPPTAPLGLALTAGLAIYGIETGLEDWEQGRRFEWGRGGGVFTREQEDAAMTLQAMGILSIVFSVADLGEVAKGAVTLVRAPRIRAALPEARAATQLDEIVGVEATAGRSKVHIEGLDEGVPRITITRPDGRTERLVLEELEAATPVARGGDSALAGLDDTAFLQQTRGKPVLSTPEAQRELDLARASGTRRPPSEPGYIDEIAVGGEHPHVWRQNTEGLWCRFSQTGICYITLRNRGGSVAPVGYRLQRIRPEARPDIIPRGTVLEFPGGERVWRSASEDGGIVIESRLGPASRRKDYERELFSRGEMDSDYVRSNLERAHSHGAGTGHENPYAIAYAPAEVNQALQNTGIELYMRELQRLKPPGVEYHLITETKIYPGSRRLRSIEYRVDVSHGGQRRRLFEVDINVSDSVTNPTVRLSDPWINPDPRTIHSLPIDILPDTIRERLEYIFSRRRPTTP